MAEDETFVIEGPPPLRPIPDAPLGKIIYDRLIVNPSDEAALVDAITGQHITYKQILGRTCSLAESLLRNGYGKTTIAAICSENSVEFFIPVIAAFYVGAAVVPLNNNYTEHELIHVTHITKPELIFCTKQVLKKFVVLKARRKFIKKIVVINSDEDIQGVECLNSFVSRSLHGGDTLYRFQPADLNVDAQTGLIMCSSGTTGLPKGVMVSQRSLLARIMMSEDSRYFLPEPGQCTLGVLPFFHAYGLLINLACITKHIKIIVLPKFEENLFLKTIQDYKISELFLVPPLAVLLSKSPLVSKYDLTSVQNVVCGAAPLSSNTEELLIKRLNVACLRQGYGLTETTLGVIGSALDQQKPGSVGKVFPYMKCKVRDPETGKSLGPNTVGELCFKGPLVMKGYYGNPKATRETFTSDGWLLSGDLGYYDQDQFFYIVDRLKELIKYKGFQVAPAELESLLLTHPNIRDAGVVGLSREEDGEVPLAFVVKDPNSSLTEKEVEDFVAGLVSPQKRLRGGVVFVKSIPKNPSGKILRRELRKMLTSQELKL